MHRFLAPVLFLAVAVFVVPAEAQTATDTLHAHADSAAAADDAADAAARNDSLQAVITMRARAQAHYEEGSQLLQADDYEAALIRFEDGIAVDPSSVGNTYGRAFALAQLGREEEAVEGFMRAAIVAESVGDTAAVRLARNSRDGLVARRASAVAPVYSQVDEILASIPPTLEAGNQAVQLMSTLEGRALEDLAFHYRWARSLNAAERFADASEHAENAIRLSEDEEDRSAYYYEMGVALKGMGQSTPAREAFDQARTGAWAAWAEYQIAAMGR